MSFYAPDDVALTSRQAEVVATQVVALSMVIKHKLKQN